MTDFPDFKLHATHGPTGRTIWKRTTEFTHTGNNEGTMTQEVSVREADGTEIGGTEFSIEWEYFGQIDASFNENGAEVRVSGRGEPSELLALPPAP